MRRAGHSPSSLTASSHLCTAASSRPALPRTFQRRLHLSPLDPAPRARSGIASSVLILSGSAACFSSGLWHEISHLPSPFSVRTSPRAVPRGNASGCGMAQGYGAERTRLDRLILVGRARLRCPSPMARKQMALNTRTVSMRARGRTFKLLSAAAGLSRSPASPLFDSVHHSPRHADRSRTQRPRSTALGRRPARRRTRRKSSAAGIAIPPPRRSELQLGVGPMVAGLAPDQHTALLSRSVVRLGRPW